MLSLLKLWLLAWLPLAPTAPLDQHPLLPLPHLEPTSSSQARALSPDPSTLQRPPWIDPRSNGGSLLNRNLWGAGEPLNVILSAHSSPDILRETGLVAYLRSLGLWEECARLHFGDPQEANLGDGKGWERELFLVRESRWPYVGACLESVTGGNHARVYKQNGTEADSGAWFLAASKEVDWRRHHKIAHDGYNVGRDLLVEKATSGSHYLGRSWEATVEWVEGLLEPGNRGIAHGIPQDGRVAVLTVTEY
ncbi:hypothetical protein DMC30DRAFT_414646 [Rhodotorula diobovata]|uniref:Uncharacterized protein n=1 Tax=Rhodotorula diobovata TaxID=5288 RepID=A0A5C5G1D1_9BASI|nr:hypothetical protein DMC30DRAFT_414646 [Rhodotorula diobovata]